ncbi:MAG TPA: choice-of-anchor J domain-containing protein [Fluviicola sp.]|nr:choice-of-anchor J domain-containing protein [Fluviicola sp.]
MKKIILFSIALVTVLSAKAQIIFSEDFDGISGPTAGGAGTYTFPPGWLLRNVDNGTPAGAVAYVNEAWERREDFAYNVADSAAFSTSWTVPAGTSNDWMWTPSFTVQPNTVLKWNAITYDASYQEGYEVRVMVSPNVPSGGTGVIGNQITNSTQIFSIAAENTTWTARSVSLNAYAGQTVYIGFRNISTDKFLLLIDDVVAEVQVANDLRVVSGTVGHGEYTVAPSDQLTTAQNILLKGSIYNQGMSAATNVALGCKVFVNGTQVADVQSTTTPSLAAAATDAKTINYTPTQDGTYSFKFYPIMTAADQNISNDTVVDPTTLVVDPYLMRRDDGTPVGSLGIGAGNGGLLGQTFNFETAVDVESVSAFFTTGDAGEEMACAIYNTNGAGVPTTLFALTDTLFYPDDSARLYTMPISGGILNFPAGKYAFFAIEFDSTLALANTNTIYTPNSAYVSWPTNPNGAGVFSPVESFDPAYAKPFVIWPNFNLCVGETGGSLASSTEAGCGQSDGTAVVNLDPGYTVLWEDNSTNDTITGLPAGVYTYTMDNGFCSFTDSVVITNPGAPTATMDTIIDALCNGGTGSIAIDIQGGTPSYDILWSDGSTNQTLTAGAGTYSVTVTDSAFCQATVINLTISEPTALTTTASATDESCPNCDDGTATASPAGGTAPYTYLWSNGQTTNPATGLAPGAYTVEITDANGCTVTSSSVTVGEDVTGITELADYGVVIYPNPVVDFLAIEATKGTITHVSLLDASGRFIADLTKADNVFTTDMRHLAKGVYKVVIQTAERTIIASVAKQ